MKSEELTIPSEQFVVLLEAAYQKVTFAEDPKMYRVTRVFYLLGILTCFLLANFFPEYRQFLGGVILLIGIFLFSTSVKYNMKKREQKRAKKPFDQMLYQITEISQFKFSLDPEGLLISLNKRDGSKRELSYNLSGLSAFQQLKGAFLISNEEGIDFIIPEGLFQPDAYQQFSKAAAQVFDSKNM